MEIKSTTHAVSRTFCDVPDCFAPAALTLCWLDAPRAAADLWATVNGEAITHGEIDSHLEATSGDSALRQLIDYSLVMQKLKAEGLSISDDQVNKQIEKMRAIKSATGRCDSGRRPQIGSSATSRSLRNGAKYVAYQRHPLLTIRH